MIKRRFYRAERGDKEDPSSDSSSDSDVEVRSSDESDQEDEPAQTDPRPEPEPDSSFEVDNDDDDEHSPLKFQQHPSSSSSGYESEDSSAHEIEADSGGLLTNDDDSGSGKDGDQLSRSSILRKENGEIIEMHSKDQPAVNDLPRCVLKSKTVYKCRLCPKIVCLNEETLRTHLKSKRHSRSEKLLSGGRLKRFLNSDGEEEVISDNDCETHAERHARIIALAQETSMKKSKGRQRQRLRLKRKLQKQKNSSDIPNSGQPKENRAKRRRKNAD